jgi:hypothetical protein
MQVTQRQPHGSSGAFRPRPRFRPGSLFIALLAMLALLYGGAAVWLMTQETRLVFQAGRTLSTTRPPFPYEQVDVTRADGRRQFAWIMRAPHEAASRPWVVFLHGNQATIASRGNIAHYAQLRALGLNVFAPEYRGFGGLEGTPSEASVGEDARAGYDHVRHALGVPAARIVIYGWSLGGAIAVDLASRVPSAAVVLEAPPASLVAIGQHQYPFFPIRMLMRNPFNAVDKAGAITAPTLILHSPADEVIPVSEGRRLYEAVRAPKTFVEIRGGHVNASETDSARFYAAVRTFLTTHSVLER